MTAAHTTPKPRPFAMFHAYFLLIFLVLFPKGGIKAGSIPLTWGYLYLGLTAPFLFLVRLLAMPLRMRGSAVAVLGMLLPMQTLLLYAYLGQGVINTGYSVSMFTGLIVLPWLFLMVYPPFFNRVNPERIATCLRLCMLVAALWGLFLFFLHPITGHYIEIPYLTVNAADYGLLETTKFNARGFYLKLISTYNNGNVYGVATLILLPLYNHLEPARWKRGVLLAAALLTLSRTVWVGLVVLQIAPLLLLLFRQLRTFPVLYLASAGRRIVSVVVIVGLVLFVLFTATSSGLEFILDPTLGGRAGELSTTGITFLPPGPVAGFDESLYGSAGKYYGVAGAVAFTLIMASPMIILLFDRSALRSPIRMAAFGGLMIYAVLAASDGAFVLIPVMAFYWFTYSVFLHGWPGTKERFSTSQALAAVTTAKPRLLLRPS